MKSLQKALLAVIAGSVMTMSAQAALNYAGQPYAGVKIGQYSPDDAEDDAGLPAARLFGGRSLGVQEPAGAVRQRGGQFS